MKKLCILSVLFVMVCGAAGEPISRDPYVGAIAVDARTGAVLFEDNADRPAYPASML